MENNPIQQRMFMLEEKWTRAINMPNVKVVRIHAEQDENTMIDDFFIYMLAVDTDQEDLVVVFNSSFNDIKDYSKDLLSEFKEEIALWNESEKPESMPFEHIDWQPDFTLSNNANPAALFIENMNRFASYIIPDKKTKVSLILRMFNAEEKEACTWLDKALEVEFEPHLVLGINDDDSFPLYNKFVGKHPKEVYTLIPNLDMDGAVEALAAMGDPTEKETSYRTHFVKLMNAVKNRNEKAVEKESKNCLDIALQSLKNDTNWITQIVAVYTVLYNDQLGYKNYEDAIYFADKACEASLYSIERVEPDMSYRLVGQSHLGRGSLYSLVLKWQEAQNDFRVAETHYGECQDYLMQCEALRLCAWAFEKNNQSKQELETYLEAYQLIDKILPETIKASSFPLLAKKLYEHQERLKYLSDQEMDIKMAPIFGDDWRSQLSI